MIFRKMKDERGWIIDGADPEQVARYEVKVMAGLKLPTTARTEVIDPVVSDRPDWWTKICLLL
jgi:hypothetical protein